MNIGSAPSETDAVRARLLLWISDNSKGGQRPFLADFAEAEQPIDIDADHMDVILSDLLTEDLVSVGRVFGGTMAASASLTDKGRHFVQTMRDARANQRLREIAIREALVCWLNEKRLVAAPVDAGACPIPMFLLSPQAIFCGEPFTNDEQDRALRYLNENGLIEHNPAYSTARLTSDGIDCASDYDCNVREYMMARNRPQGTNYNVTNYGDQPMIAQGPGITQSQHNADTGPVLTAIAELLQTIEGDDTDEAERLRAAAVLVQDEAESDTPDRGFVAGLVNRMRTIGDKAETVAISAGVTAALPIIEQWVQTLT